MNISILALPIDPLTVSAVGSAVMCVYDDDDNVAYIPIVATVTEENLGSCTWCSMASSKSYKTPKQAIDAMIWWKIIAPLFAGHNTYLTPHPGNSYLLREVDFIDCNRIHLKSGWFV